MWTHTREELDEFIEHLNTRTEHYKFTSDISETHTTFLDTTVKITNGELVTDLYSKPTDSHNYLMYNSSHPQRCKDSIPYSQFLRIRRICSRIEDFDTHVVSYSAHFLRRNYPLELLKEAVILSREQDRKELLSPKTKDTPGSDKVFLISTYHPHDLLVRAKVPYQPGDEAALTTHISNSANTPEPDTPTVMYTYLVIVF